MLLLRALFRIDVKSELQHMEKLEQASCPRLPENPATADIAAICW
jgi:hypothetical protein